MIAKNELKRVQVAGNRHIDGMGRAGLMLATGGFILSVGMLPLVFALNALGYGGVGWGWLFGLLPIGLLLLLVGLPLNLAALVQANRARNAQQTRRRAITSLLLTLAVATYLFVMYGLPVLLRGY